MSARFGAPRPQQPRSLTPAQQRARATRPDLWPAFLAPDYTAVPPAPALDEYEQLVSDLRSHFGGRP